MNVRIITPVIIFKLANIPREDFPDGVIIRTNMEGWMNENEMIWWVGQNVQIETVIRDFFWYWILLLHIRKTKISFKKKLI